MLGLFRRKPTEAAGTGSAEIVEELSKMRASIDALRMEVAKLVKAYDILNDTICDKLEGVVSLDDITTPD